MSLKTWMLGMAAAGFAARWYSHSRRNAPDARRAFSGMGSESPNTAERLEAGNRINSPVGQGTPAERVGDDDHLFDSSSQHGTGPINTGLTDFSRGA